MKAILLATLLLAGCDHAVQVSAPLPPSMMQPVPLPHMDEAAMIDPITVQNTYFLYHEKVKPAFLACIKRGLVKRADFEEMSRLNKLVAKELPLAQKAYEANDFEAWKLHHGIAYRSMGKMLVLTNAVPIRKEMPPVPVILNDVLKAVGEDGAFTRAFQTLFNAVVATLSPEDKRTVEVAYSRVLAAGTMADVDEVQAALDEKLAE